MIFHKFDDEQFFFHRDVVTERDVTPINKQHYHNLFEIYYIKSGKCVYFINNKSYALLPRDIILIPEGTIHNTEYRTSAHTRLLINCSKRFIPASVLPLLPQMVYLYRNPAISEEVERILLQIEEEYKKKDSLHEDVLRTLTHMFFLLLARNLKTHTQFTPSSNYCDYIEKAVDFLQNHFTSEISLPEIADMFSVTPVHFSRRFKKETGFGFCEYINILRLQRAEELIRQGYSASVIEIASECGFSDSNYFSVKFKSMYGISPKALILKSHQLN